MNTTHPELRTQTYLALLRGINVGGRNIIKMAELKACFEAEGFGSVSTYIQSGNVVFTTAGAQSATLTSQIEKMLRAAFDYQANVVLRTHRQMQTVVSEAPDGFGERPKLYRYDVVFLKAPLTAETAMQSVRTRAGVDEAYTGRGVLYFSRLTSRAAQSRLSRLVSMPVYQSMTIRNWNTTTKLLRRMEET